MNKILMKKTFLLLFLVTWVISCEEESDPAFDTENFTAIFDNNQFSATYDPIDFKQTADGGYLILGTREAEDSDFNGIYLMKADKFGNFVSEVNVDQQYVNPIDNLTEINGKFYFICMDELNVVANIVEVSADGEVNSFTPLNSGLTYPNSMSFVDNQFIIQGYDYENRETVVALAGIDGNVVNSKSFTIGVGDTDDLHARILNHYIRTGRQFPFSVGKAGAIYFNGFYDFTFSMGYTNLQDDEPNGLVQGQQENGGMSALLPLGGSKFAASIYNFGDNYLLPNVILATGALSSSVTLAETALKFPELVPDARVRIVKATVDTKNTVIFGSTTISKQIGLFLYDEASGAFLGSRYLGFSNPFEIGSVIQTSDGGIAVCGTTFLAGRFPRICIFKISKEEFAKSLKE